MVNDWRHNDGINDLSNMMFEDSEERFEKLVGVYERIWPTVESAGYLTDDLSECDRNFLLVYMADNAINSNGIYSLWFNNHGFLDTPAVVEAFRSIGAPRSAQIVERFILASHRIPVSKNLRFRSLQLGLLSLVWPDDERLSGEYFDSGEDIDALLLAYLASQPSKK